MSVNLGDIAVLNIERSDYCCIISLMSKNEAINFLQNADLAEKSGTLSVKKIYIFLKVCIKIEKAIIKFDDIKV